MLLSSMSANAARRLLARAPAPTALRLPATQAIGAATIRFPCALPIRAFTVSKRTAFPTAKTVKKKTTTASKKAPSKTKAPAKAKKTTKSTAKTTKAKKPVAKRKTVAASKKKTTAKKLTPGRKKRPLTDEEKHDRERRELKKVVLKEPHNLPDRPWPVYIAEWCKNKTGSLVERIQGASQAYKALNASELERIKSTAEKNKLTNQAAYKTWVESFPLAEVKAANLARARLTKKHDIPMRQIRDERMPKKPRNAYSFFVSSKWQSGQVTGVGGDSAKAMGREWKTMPAAQKQPYEELAAADSARYKGAMKTAGL